MERYITISFIFAVVQAQSHEPYLSAMILAAIVVGAIIGLGLFIWALILVVIAYRQAKARKQLARIIQLSEAPPPYSVTENTYVNVRSSHAKL